MTEARRRILVIEDDNETGRQLVDFLSTRGYQVDLAVNGDDGLRLGRTAEYGVMTIDRMLPGIDGIGIIRRLRDDEIATPALIISALGEVDDRVRGLRAGGDDYLVKPFAFMELLAQSRGSGTAQRRRGERHRAARGRSGTGSRVAHCQPRRPNNRSFAARVSSSRISRTQRGTGRSAGDAVATCVGSSFRHHDEHHRRLCRPRAPQSRQSAKSDRAIDADRVDLISALTLMDG